MFNNCQNIDELQKEWRKQALRLHPDKGGNAADFQRAHAEYLRAKQRIEANTPKGLSKNQLEIIGQVGEALLKVSRGEDWISAALGILRKQ
ncbi:MAG: hypothetical protein E7069_12170 [Bacteroidales bacterium]|jgi:chromosome segregation and condensation protein ScpB|nr:hypothetical protein [Bacteroidales bacterium]